MIIVRLKGGLGNQLFQYATGRALSILHNTELKLDLSYLKADTNGTRTARDLELGHFNIQAVFSNENEVSALTKYAGSQLYRVVARNFPQFFSKIYAAETGSNFQPNFFKYPADTYLDGYWQSEKYFSGIENEIRKDLSFTSAPNSDNAAFIDKILNSNSIALHVRRGDYLSDKTEGIYAICTSEYYKKAIEYIVQKTGSAQLFIFSDDIEWCKKNIDLPSDSIFISNNTGSNSFEDIRLMSSCKHNIIANSSFSWWGAWLNQNKGRIVVAPQKWFQKMDAPNIYPANWIKI